MNRYENFQSTLTLHDFLILLQNILPNIPGKKTFKDKTDIFKKQHTDSILNQVFIKTILKINEIARP